MEAICILINVLTKLKYFLTDVTLLRLGYISSTRCHNTDYTGTKKSEFTLKMF